MKRAQLVMLMILALVPVLAVAQGGQVSGLIVFKAEGVGTMTVTNVGQGVATSGTLRGDPIGFAEYTSVYSTDAIAETNGTGGICTRGTGPVVITTADGSTLDLRQVAFGCATSAPQNPNNWQTSNGTYLVTGGTGRFQGATGAGTIVLGIYGNNAGSPAFVHIDGNIRLP